MSFSETKPKKVTEFAPIKKVTLDGNWLFIILFVLILLCAALTSITAYTYFQWRAFEEKVQSKTNFQFSESKNFISSNVKAFDERLENLEKIVEPFSLLDPQNTLSSAVEKANSEVFKKNEEVVTSLKSEIEVLREDLKVTKSRVEESTKRELIFVSLINLKQKIDSALPFKSELEIAISVASDDATLIENLSSLKAAAENGYESFSSLRDRFSKIASEVVKDEQKTGEETAYQKVINNILSSVTIRKTGFVEGSDVESVIARAEELLSKGNLSGAIKELEKANISNENYKNWLESAKNLAGIDGIFSNIISHITKNTSERHLNKYSPKAEEIS